MTKTVLPMGFILLARKLWDSDLWRSKPSWWLKVWIYMLLGVNYQDDQHFKRGQGFFNTKIIYNECGLYLDGIDSKSIDNVFRWLRATSQITTHKTTRGIVITIVKYNEYQNIRNFINDTRNDTQNDLETRQKRDRNDTIDKEVKERKENKPLRKSKYEFR